MFDKIDQSLNAMFNKREDIPTNLEIIYYIFWEKGISLNEINELPIPYIMNILKTHRYIQKEQEKEMKKNGSN